MLNGSRSFAAGFLLVALWPVWANADTAPAAPVRHLVYSFTYGTSSDLETHVSGFGAASGSGSGDVNNAGGNGMTDSTGGAQDKGTITVDVMAERPDGALVVMVSEAAQNSRTAVPAACVVFDNTGTLCDPAKKVNEEEIAVVRLLGPHFVNPSQFDDKQHWKSSIAGKGFAQSSDFRVVRNADGVMTITEDGSASQSGIPHVESSTTATIGYKPALQVVTSLTTYTIARQQQSIESHLTQKSQTTATLITDSLATKN